MPITELPLGAGVKKLGSQWVILPRWGRSMFGVTSVIPIMLLAGWHKAMQPSYKRPVPFISKRSPAVQMEEINQGSTGSTRKWSSNGACVPHWCTCAPEH